MAIGSLIRSLVRWGGLLALILLCWSAAAYGQGTVPRPGPAPVEVVPPPPPATSEPAEAPPELEIPESSLKSGLLASDLSIIERYVAYWVDKLASAGAEQGILDARTRLIRGYNQYENWQFQGAYAERVAKVIGPLLDSPDVRKQVNAAMAVAQMREVAVQPVLESLVVSRNPALRLYGWTGYRRILLLVLAQGKESVTTMLTSLDKAAAAEECGPVMSAVLDMMYLAPDRPSIVSAAVFDETRGRLFEVFRKSWPRVCKKVLDGHPGMVRAAAAGLDALRRVGTDEDASKDTQLGAIQMVVDLAWCGAKCYAAGGQTGSQVAATEALLRECETALNAITKLRKIPIYQALAVKVEANRAAEVEAAVSTWIRALENANWPVHEPEFQPSPAATQPAPEE